MCFKPPSAESAITKSKRSGILKVTTLRDSLTSSWRSNDTILNLGSSSSSNLNSTSSNDSSTRASVRFSDITIREYDLAIGDNPSCSGGPPISLDWSYSSENTLDMERFEQHRGPTRSVSQLRMPPDHRFQILREEWEFPTSRLLLVATEMSQIRKQRMKTAAKGITAQMRAERIKNVVKLFQKTHPNFDDRGCRGEKRIIKRRGATCRT